MDKTRKKEILEFVNEEVKANKIKSRSIINCIKSYINYIKTYDVQNFLNLNPEVLRDKKDIEYIKRIVRKAQNKHKFDKEEILNMLGYLSREMTYIQKG